MRVRDRVGVNQLWQRRIVWVMEASLVGMFFIGIDRGNTGIIVNTAIALAISQLPAVLERDYDIALDAGLTLWITGAVWLHAVGTVGMPGADQNFYATIWWWDHLTHALSSSVVAAVGYTTVRAIDLHSEDIYLPPRFMFVFILLFVLAFGVFWEVIEFTLGEFAALAGATSVLTQYGLEDTMLDLVFNTIGAVVVAVWGTAHLTDVVGIVANIIENRQR
ncbi:hypothetical protein OB920_04140 [Halobacteria archaeon HArc-gm2]|nr:hypothetical protein [Halobacteria archaeon HArc-gm2]